ncbi:MAG TPA: hypothetical protein VEX86_19695 [Longimicrobium sp.]|nr:hypothetical protein [Longimicrobium sp.]
MTRTESPVTSATTRRSRCPAGSLGAWMSITSRRMPPSGPISMRVCRRRTRGKRSTASLVTVLPRRVTLSTETVSLPRRATNP